MSVTSGSFVRLKSEPSRAGVVQSRVKVQAGLQMVPVQFSDGHLSWIPEQSLEPVTMALEDMATRFAKGTFVDPGWLRQTLTRTRVTGQLSDVSAPGTY